MRVTNGEQTRGKLMNMNEIFHSADRSTIVEMISRGQEENLQLDFKRVAANMTRDDRKTLAICIGGFANSSGGLIVWGVDARENALRIDCAVGLALVDPVKLLISRLNEFTGQCVSPIVDGILHRAIPFDSDAGCVISLVPESSSGPHMSKLGEDRYYKRSGDSFRCLEHFDLEDMFGRRQKLISIWRFKPIRLKTAKSFHSGCSILDEPSRAILDSFSNFP